MASIRVRVTGVEKVIRQLEMVNQKKDNLSDPFDQVGRRAVAFARMLVPFASGALAASIRHDVNNRSRLTLVAGGPSERSHGGGVYAGHAHYGTYTHRYKGPRPYLSAAAQMAERHAVVSIEDYLERIIRRNGLAPGV